MVLAMPGGDGTGTVSPNQWGHEWPASLAAVLPAHVRDVVPGGGRWKNWIQNGRPAVMAGGSFELVCTPTEFFIPSTDPGSIPVDNPGIPQMLGVQQSVQLSLAMVRNLLHFMIVTRP